ncbi:hypothetical protein WJX74_004991 [Apatococcus lobatus]|uniref:Uncharacterized protein n=1 Tax=Apatococcus lobatus TaxID=904363 RepID=A0AAW1S965_9CHLO
MPRLTALLAFCSLRLAGHALAQPVAESSSGVTSQLHSLFFGPNLQQDVQADRIPKILHHVYLAGEKELRAATHRPEPPMRIEWSESCVLQHDGWQVMFWDMPAVLRLLQDHYPWFLRTFQSYRRRVQQGDAIRYFILNTHGGLYMDLDVECYRSTASFLRGFDVVLNVELGNKVTVTNAVMASIPNATLWKHVFMLLRDIAKVQRNDLEADVVQSTGPWMLTDVLKGYLTLEGDSSAGEYLHPARNITSGQEPAGPLNEVYEVGTWFTPCIFDDERCHEELARNRTAGIVDLQRIAGYHRYQGTWKPCMGECFKQKDHRNKGEQEPLQGVIKPARKFARQLGG